MSISDLAEAYSILAPSLSDEDRRLATDRLFAAWLAAASVYEGAITPDEGSEFPGYDKYDFEAALEAAGFRDLDMAWQKWGLDALPLMPLDDRKRKMAQIRAVTDQPVQERHVAQVLQAPFEGPDVTRCPRCGSSGKEFSWGRACNNAECRRPNGKHTTWDDKNWQARKAE